MTEITSVDVVIDEGSAFIDRHRDELNETQQAMGGLIWGLMRGIAECPTCPGVFRTPIGEQVGCASALDVLGCPQCRQIWATAEGRAALGLRQGRLL